MKVDCSPPQCHRISPLHGRGKVDIAHGQQLLRRVHAVAVSEHDHAAPGDPVTGLVEATRVGTWATEQVHLEQLEASVGFTVHIIF